MLLLITNITECLFNPHNNPMKCAYDYSLHFIDKGTEMHRR